MIRQMWGSPNWAKGRDKFGEGIDIEKNYLQSVCIPCQRQQAKDRYLNHPESVKEINKASRHKSRDEAHRYVAEYLQSHPCTDCGESDPVVLTFDHVIGNKRMNVADMVTQGYALGEIEKEIAKCEVTCFNCHMRREKKEEGQDIELCK